MSFANNIIINLYSMLILIIIYRESMKHSEKDTFQYRLFMKMTIITFIMLGLDILSRFDGNPGTIYSFFNYWGNFLMFSINVILPSIWFAYVHYQVFHEEESTKKLFYPLLAINLLNLGMTIGTQFFGWYYYIDSANIYHRGPLFLISHMFTIILLIMSFGITILNHSKIEKRFYYSLLFFSLPPLIAIIIQVNFYGVSLILSGVTLSILIAFVNIQNYSIYTDFLTGVNNRMSLEIHLKEKINSTDIDNTFSAIMIDLDGFKEINDIYGHSAGDEALKTSAQLFKSSIRSIDFIARFGGDEFWIVLDTADVEVLEKIIQRMKVKFDLYNETSNNPYNLKFSYGYGVYEFDSNMNAEEFKMHIDNLMYKNKRRRQGDKNVVTI